MSKNGSSSKEIKSKETIYLYFDLPRAISWKSREKLQDSDEVRKEIV